MGSSRPKLYEYAKCDTCRKAKRWLEARAIEFDVVPIVDSPPSAAELRRLMDVSGLSTRRWFNTSGGSYRELVRTKGKPYMDALSPEDAAALLSADGKLIKRPLLVATDRVLVGFRDDEYASFFATSV